VYVVMVRPSARGGQGRRLGDVVSGLSRELELRGTRSRSSCRSTPACGTRYLDLQPSYRDLWCRGTGRSTAPYGSATQAAEMLLSASHADEALYDDGASGSPHPQRAPAQIPRVLNGSTTTYGTPRPTRSAGHYSAGTIARKSENRAALRDQFWLRRARSPVVAYVGRLDEQKACTWSTMPSSHTGSRGQFVLIGMPLSRRHHRPFPAAQGRPERQPGLPPRNRLPEELAHLIYAARTCWCASMFERAGWPADRDAYGPCPWCGRPAA